MKTERGTISVSLVEETLALARARGVDLQPIVEAAGIAPQVLASPKSRVTPAQYGALWANIARTLDDEFFGQDPHAMKSGSFIAMTQTALTARNGGQALTRAVNFMRLVLDDMRVQIVTRDDRVRLAFAHRDGAPQPAMFAYATYFILVYGLVCWLVGRRIPLIEARFSCAEPPAAHEYRLMFCDDLSFGQSESYVDLAPDFLELPVVQTTRSIKPFLRDAPASFIIKYRNPGSLAARAQDAARAADVRLARLRRDGAAPARRRGDDAASSEAGRLYVPVDQGRLAARHRDFAVAARRPVGRRHRGDARICRAERVSPGVSQMDGDAAGGLSGGERAYGRRARGERGYLPPGGTRRIRLSLRQASSFQAWRAALRT